MNIEPLVRAIVAAFLFLEHSGADEIDPDAAVRSEENIGAELDLLSDAERAEFRRVIEKIASSSGDPHYAEFVRKVPLMLWGPGEEQVTAGPSAGHTERRSPSNRSSGNISGSASTPNGQVHSVGAAAGWSKW